MRRAFILLFDAEWINRNLFNGALQAHAELLRALRALLARPAGRCARARAARALPRQYVKPEVLDGTFQLPVTDGSGDNRANLQAAHKLLTEAGYKLEGDRLVKGGVPLDVEFLAQTRQQERLMLSYARTLERLGIGLRIRQVDTAQYWSRLKTFDFDMMQWTWSASLSPGNEQINRWSSKAADDRGLAQLSPASRTPPPTP